MSHLLTPSVHRAGAGRRRVFTGSRHVPPPPDATQTRGRVSIKLLTIRAATLLICASIMIPATTESTCSGRDAMFVAEAPVASEWLTSGPFQPTPAQVAPATDAINHLLSEIVRSEIPHTYSDTDDWGMTDTRWDGLHVHMDGLRIKTKRRRREVNHGDWKMYTCELIDPNREFSVSFGNVHRGEDGRMRFEIDLVAQLRLHGRVARWVKGVQLYSFSADANAEVHLTLQCATQFRWDFVNFPPDVVLDVEATEATIDLARFDLFSVSKLGGEAAQQMGRAMHDLLQDKIDDKRDRLIEKINREIEEHADELRFSVHDLVEDQVDGLVEDQVEDHAEEVVPDQ